MAGGRDYDKQRLKELALYIADKCRDDASFGATKLNKILFYVDFLAFGLYGQSVTGAVYFRIPRGPAPHQLKPITQELWNDGEARIEIRKRYNFAQKRLTPERAPEVDMFAGHEISLTDDVIASLWGKSATETSELSHRELGWLLASDQQELPYGAVFLSLDQPTDQDREWARGVGERDGAVAGT